MRKIFKMHWEGDLLILENPSYPPVKIEFDCHRRPEVKKVHVSGKCKISEVKKTLKQMVFYAKRLSLSEAG